MYLKFSVASSQTHLTAMFFQSPTLRNFSLFIANLFLVFVTSIQLQQIHQAYYAYPRLHKLQSKFLM